MNKLFLSMLCLAVIATSSCKKDDTTTTTPATEAEVLSDFTTVLAVPNYQDINTKAAALNDAVIALNANTTDANLATAQAAWRALRQPWELCEAFLFGPVEDFNYDPTTDTWPVDKTRMDSLLASSNALSLSDINAPTFDDALKGYHPIEYVLFGEGGTRTAAGITPKQMTYLVSLTQSLYNTTTEMHTSWLATGGNFSAQVVNAGTSLSTRYTTKQAAFLDIVSAMAGICDEVGGGKMEEPLAALDSTLEESQFSHNSTADFKNNITGIQNVYFCKWNGQTGKSLHDLVAAKNLSLDNTITQQLSTAISSFDAINASYGVAIHTQAVQIHNTQAALEALKTTLEGDLHLFIQTNIKD